MTALRLAITLFITISILACTPNMNTVFPSDPHIQTIGRTRLNDDNSITFGYPGTGFRFVSNAQTVTITASSTSDYSILAARINNGTPTLYTLTSQPQTLALLSQLSHDPKEIELLHYTETWQGIVTINQIGLSDGQLLPPPERHKKRILFVGDSVTCGEGAGRDGTQACEKNNRWWNAHHSYGWLTGEQLNADVHLVCFGGRGLIRSWDGNSQELNGPDFYQLTIAEPGSERWQHQRFPADIVVVSLGTNDFNRAIGPMPTADDFVPAYVAFVKTILEDYPQATIILTEGAIVSDQDPSFPQKSVLREYLQTTRQQVDNSRVHVFESSQHPGDHCDGHPTGPQHESMSNELVTFIRQTINE